MQDGFIKTVGSWKVVAGRKSETFCKRSLEPPPSRNVPQATPESSSGSQLSLCEAIFMNMLASAKYQDGLANYLLLGMPSVSNSLVCLIDSNHARHTPTRACNAVCRISSIEGLYSDFAKYSGLKPALFYATRIMCGADLFQFCT